MKIRSTIDLYYAIPATVFLAVLFSYVRFFHLAFYDDLNVTGGLSFVFSTVTLFFCWQINTHLLTYLF